MNLQANSTLRARGAVADASCAALALALLAGLSSPAPALAQVQAQAQAQPGASSAAPAVTPPTVGAEGEVETVVITAPRYVPSESVAGTKTGTPLIETPQSITVINRDQIDLLNIQDIGQAVRYTAGVAGEIFGDDQRYDWVTVRGFYPVEYIDGLQAPVGSVSNTGVDLWGFDSLEILKGPSSTLYGATPPGGIVNLTSRRPLDQFGGEIQALGGSFNDKQLAGDVTGPITDGLDYRFTALYRDRDTQTQNDYDRRYYLAPALTWKIDQATSLTFLSYYQFDKLMNDGDGFLPAYGVLLPNPDGRIPTDENLGQRGYNDFRREQWGIGYDFRHDFSRQFSFEQNLKYFGNNSSTLDIYGAGLATNADNSLNYGEVNRYNFPFKEKIRSLNVDNRLTARFDLGPVSNTLLVGLDYRNYTLRSAFGFSVAPSVSLADPQVYIGGITTPPYSPYTDEQQAQIGYYIQDQAKIGRLVLTASGREDWVDSYNGTTSPTNTKVSKFTYRGGINYVLDSGLAPYVAYATSFQPVTGTQLNGTPFVPTTGDQVEGGLKYEPRFLPAHAKTLATAAVFDLHQNNVLAPDLTTLPISQMQIGHVHVAGVELEDVTRINDRLSINFAYSYLFSKGSAAQRTGGPFTPAAQVGTYNTDPPLYMTPRNKAAALVDYTFATGLLKGFGLGGGVRYQGATFGDSAGEWRNPSVVLWDGLVHYNWAKWRLQVDVTNLFDKTYIAQCSSYSDCYWGLRRNAQASLTRAF